jgi:hypothetical protein
MSFSPSQYLPVTGSDVCEEAEVVEARRSAKLGAFLGSFQGSIGQCRKRLSFRIIRNALFRHDYEPVYSLSGYRDINARL